MMIVGEGPMTKRKKKRPLSQKQRQPAQIIGVAWYTPEQWERLRSLAADADTLDDTHQDWLKNATDLVQWLKKQGFRVVKVPLDIDEWVAWCQKNGKALDGTARSEFTSQKVSERFEGSSPTS
jgi:trans-aconitate methyltransferase